MTFKNLLSIIIAIVFILIVFGPLILQMIKRNKEEALLNKQDKKLKEMMTK